MSSSSELRRRVGREPGQEGGDKATSTPGTHTGSSSRARNLCLVLLCGLVVCALALYTYVSLQGPLPPGTHRLLPFLPLRGGAGPGGAAKQPRGAPQPAALRDPAWLAARAHPLSVCAPKINMTSKESYSLWAQPKGRMGEQLKAEIAHLAERHGANPFPPHVTVLGDIEKPRAEMEALMEQLAARTKKYRINFTDVTRGSIFYQCVYLLVAKDPGTMAAAQAAREVFGRTTPPYMPHLSLLYSDMEDGERLKVVDYEIGRLYGANSSYDTLMVENGYDVDSISLWYTPTDDTGLRSWCLVGEYELQV